ncbi:MAG TPA: hypothetical protein VJP58_02480 [Candidatus Nitrosocosmicus sp.]|nr:hypothetical protein [Candidatus Nitrosocosmicus sp.]
MSYSEGFSIKSTSNRNKDNRLFIKIKNKVRPNKITNLLLFTLYHENSFRLANKLIDKLKP